MNIENNMEVPSAGTLRSRLGSSSHRVSGSAPWQQRMANRASHVAADIWVNYTALTVLPHWKSWLINVNKGNHSQMAQQFRFIYYCTYGTYSTYMTYGRPLMFCCTTGSPARTSFFFLRSSWPFSLFFFQNGHEVSSNSVTEYTWIL
jgi:hypothetical protein